MAKGTGRAVTPPRRPTILDVAKTAGVSFKTVSRVVNSEAGVRAETLARVLAAVEALGFRRNDMASGLRAGRTSPDIGLIIEDVANPFYSAIAKAVEDVARAHGALVITGSSEEDPARERELVEALMARRVDGLLIVPAGRDHRYLKAEAAMGTAVVFIDRPPVGLAADAVLIDNLGGAKLAVSHFAAAGHRRIAVLGDRPDIQTMVERVKGFRHAMAAEGLEVDESLIRMGLHTPDDIAAAMSELLDLPHPPTAVFPLNNRMTVGAVRSIWERGVKVEVVGFDDFELSEMLPLRINVVAYDVEGLGRTGAELLFERLAGASPRPRRIVAPTRLVERGRPFLPA